MPVSRSVTPLGWSTYISTPLPSTSLIPRDCMHVSGMAFGGFTLRERQNTRVRVEVSAVHPTTNERRKFATMFAAVESRKVELRIQEYSISQTSLEQIFNQFAAQQEEEVGPAAGISS